MSDTTTKADLDAAREYYENHSVADEIATAEPGDPITSAMSGYSVRLPNDVLEQARKIAGEQGMTTGAWLREAIENAVATHAADPNDRSGAVPIAELLALVAKHQQDEQDDQPALGPRSAADMAQRRGSNYRVMMVGPDWATPDQILRRAPAALLRPVADNVLPDSTLAKAWPWPTLDIERREQLKQVVEEWVKDNSAGRPLAGRRDLLFDDAHAFNQVKYTAGYTAGLVKWVRVVEDDAETARTNDKPKRHVQRPVHGRRRAKS